MLQVIQKETTNYCHDRKDSIAVNAQGNVKYWRWKISYRTPFFSKWVADTLRSRVLFIYHHSSEQLCYACISWVRIHHGFLKSKVMTSSRKDQRGHSTCFYITVKALLHAYFCLFRWSEATTALKGKQFPLLVFDFVRVS